MSLNSGPIGGGRLSSANSFLGREGGGGRRSVCMVDNEGIFSPICAIGSEENGREFGGDFVIGRLYWWGEKEMPIKTCLNSK